LASLKREKRRRALTFSFDCIHGAKESLNNSFSA